jgi:protocatechuate 3,4-dioxygenase beta subunit
LFLAVFAVGAGAAPQSTGKGTIGGQVVGTDGRPVAGARVTLQPSDGRRARTTETNDQGHFWFPTLGRGLYDVRAYSGGRWSDWHRNVNVERGQQTNVTLRLRAKKSSPAKSSPQTP